MNTQTPLYTLQSLRGMIPAFVLALGACAVDFATPLGVAVGVLFVLPVMATLPLQQSRTTLIIAAISTILICIGYWVSPEGGESWKVLSNRLISIVAVWSRIIS